MKGFKKLLALAAAAAMITGTLGATNVWADEVPVSEAADESVKRGGDLKLGIGHDLVDLGVPSVGLTFQGSLIADTAIEHLCRYNQDGTLEPWLISGYEEDPDALTLTVHLREGIKFHDGSDFNADAVIFNWELWTENGNIELAGVTEYEKVDDYTIVVHLGEWNNAIATSCLYTAGAMISKEYYEANGQDAANANPCGTGPFVFSEWKKDQYVTFTANENYWIEGLPYLESVEFDFINDPATQISAFLSGEIDAVLECSADTCLTLKSNGFESETKPLISGGASTILWYSCQDEGPMGNVDVRRAIASAIDMDAIWEYCSSQTGAIYDRTIQWGPNDVWSCNPETKGYPYSEEAAKEYLEKAGYPDGFDMVLYHISNSSQDEAICVLVQDYLAKVGINASIEAVDQTRLNTISGIDGEAFTGMTLSAGRAEVDLTTYYNRTFMPDGVRWVNQVDHFDDIVDTLTEGMTCKEFEEKEAACQKLSKMVIDDYCELLPMWTSSSAMYTQGNLKDHGIYQFYYIIWTQEIAHFEE